MKAAKLIGIVAGVLMSGVALAGDLIAPPNPLPSPLKSHVQRFLDSTQTRDYQQYPRTYRASPRPFKYVASSNRFYGTVGNSYFAYTADQLLVGGSSLVRFAPRMNGSEIVPGELYLPPASIYDKFMPGSDWTPRLVDGQQFLTDFDIDDRGVHYIAYSSYGWGLLRDNGGSFRLLWHNDPGSSQVLPAEQTCSGASCPLAESILAVSDGTNYYAVVGNGGNWAVWNTTDPSAPRFVGAWQFPYRLARDANGGLIAAMNGSATVRLITTRDFVAGIRTGTTIALGGSIWAATTADGYFWFLPYGGSSTFYRVTATGVVTPFTVIGSTLSFFTAQAGAGYIVGVDGPTPTQLRLYRIEENSVVEATEVTSFMKSYYKDQNEQPSSVRHHGMLPIRYNGRTYLIWSMHGVGDVYEVSTGGKISISRNTAASLGTRNENSPNKTLGPYYGDLVTFDVSFGGSNPPATVSWSFGNPESATNTATSAANGSVTHRYAGLTTAAAISAPKSVTATALGDPTITDIKTLELLVPTARIRVPGTNALIESSKDLGRVLIGGQFLDASDGVIEGHKAGWKLDEGAETLQSPDAGFAAGACGWHSLSFAARYDGYDAVIPGVTYTVQPFVASATVAGVEAGMITLDSTSSVGATSSFTPGAQWKEKWELLDSSGNVLSSKEVLAPIGNRSSFSVSTSEIPQTGGRARLTVTIDASVAPADCKAYLTDSIEIALQKPDPDIVTTLCSSPTTAEASCRLSIRSLTGKDMSDWTIEWFLDDKAVSTGTTFLPVFPSAGAHTVAVRATNRFGFSGDWQTFEVTLPVCGIPPKEGSLSFTAVPVAPRELSFRASSVGYEFQDCDTFLWNFGDGKTATARDPVHSFTATGTYSVTLIVSNKNGSASVTRSITVDESGGYTCGTSAPSGLTISWAGASTGCSPDNSIPCSPAEDVAFSILPGAGYALEGCELASWKFSDGAESAGAQARHAFAGVGTYTVALEVTNGVGAYSTSSAFRVFDPNVARPQVSVSPSAFELKVGESLFFTGSVQSAASIESLDWTIRRVDGNQQLVRTVRNEGGISHTFAEAGEYRVEFTATNAGGVSTPAVASVNVAVGLEEHAFLIPVVARLQGNFGTLWRSDLHVLNTDPSGGPVTLDFEFKGSTPKVKSVTLSESTTIVKDLLAEIAKPDSPFNDAGPVIVRARGASPPQMWTRTYTVDSSGVATYGQFIPAISLDSVTEAGGAVAYVLPGLEISSRFRTNIGIVNPGASRVTVNVAARDNSEIGFQVGSFDVEIPALSFVQIGDLARRIPGLDSGAPFSLALRAVGNEPIVVYGSMIDQRSNDPVFVSGVRDVDQTAGDKRVQILPGAGHLEQPNGTWRSDVVVHNVDLVPVSFDLEYYDIGGNRIATATNQSLKSGAFLRVEDVLKWKSLDHDPGNSFGIVKVRTLGNPSRYPIVYQRTYKDRGEAGTFGQGIRGISRADANVSVGRPAYLPGVISDSSSYTNFGLVAVGDEASVVKVTLLDDSAGRPVGTWQYVVNGEPAAIVPSSSLIVPNIVRAISTTATKGSLLIEVISGGDVWAYASVIAAPDPTCDCTRPEHTFDPEYIPAVRAP